MRLMFRLASLVPAAALLISSPAVAGFSKIPFKYSSLTHLSYEGSLVRTTASVEETVDLLATFLRSNGASVTGIRESGNKIIQTKSDRVCEKWTNLILRAEFAAFDANKYQQFKQIDRTRVPPECSAKPSWLQYGYSAIPMHGGPGFQVTAILDRSVDLTRPTSRIAYSSILGQYSSAGAWSVLPSNVTTRQSFETQFVIFVWRDAGENTTSVYAIAVPRANGIEASPDASIGYALRHFADGKIESVAIQNILSFVTQKSLVR